MNEMRDSVVHFLTPSGEPALCEWFGLHPVGTVAELAADGVWQNHSSVEACLRETFPQVPANMGWTAPPAPWINLGGLRWEIEGFEPVLISLDTPARIEREDLISYRPGRLSVVAASLHEAA